MRNSQPVVVITGASSGIGRATALHFARKGASLVLAARREDALESLVEECEAYGARAFAVPTDTTDPEQVQELGGRAVEVYDRIDVWVNNAAVSFFSPFLDVPLKDFSRVLDVNVMGYVYGSRVALQRFRSQGTGVLINVSSIVGVIPQPYTSAYSMSKAAVRALGVSLRSELLLDKARRIHVCTVLPATIDTPFFNHAANYTGRKAVAMPPVYPPQKVAAAIYKLAASPRREVVVGGAGRAMVRRHRSSPAKVETAMAYQVDRTHLSRRQRAEATSGNLYEPSLDHRDAAVTGGWSGRRRTLQRSLAGTAALAAGGVLVRRLITQP
jgi:short-subunit dehydrogenase